jgi:uncharacterized tellurite resistance protein B-like protein
MPPSRRSTVAALLVEAAHMSACFDETERSAIERILSRRYDLPSDAAARLLTSAERLNRNFPFSI